jgi:hypothetical protein
MLQNAFHLPQVKKPEHLTDVKKSKSAITILFQLDSYVTNLEMKVRQAERETETEV